MASFNIMGGTSDIIIYGNPLLQLSYKDSCTVATKMTDDSKEGYKATDFFESVTSGGITKWKVKKDLDVIFTGCSDGGYSTKWKVYKNSSVVFANDYFAAYGYTVYSDICHLSTNDLIYFETWHEGGNPSMYNVLSVIPIFNNKKIERYNGECMLYVFSNTTNSSEANPFNTPVYSMIDKNTFYSSNELTSTKNQFKASRDFDAKFYGCSSGIYGTKWKVYKNDTVVYQNSEWASDQQVIQSGVLNFSKDDVIKITSWHNGTWGTSYEISRLILSR